MTIARRSFIAGSAAAAITLPAMASGEPDPIFAAISAWREAEATWLAKLDAFSAAEQAAAAENAIKARLDVEICGVPFAFTNDAEITYLLQNLPNRGPSRPENLERMQAAGDRFRADLAAERERVEMVRSRLDIDFLEAHAETAGTLAQSRMRQVVDTVPTTLAGLLALAEIVENVDYLFVGDAEIGMASIVTACRDLAGAESRRAPHVS